MGRGVGSDVKSVKTGYSDGEIMCPSVCGPGCWSNTYKMAVGDTFKTQMVDGSLIVKRIDNSQSWDMDLSIPCCKGPAPRHPCPEPCRAPLAQSSF